MTNNVHESYVQTTNKGEHHRSTLRSLSSWPFQDPKGAVQQIMVGFYGVLRAYWSKYNEQVRIQRGGRESFQGPIWISLNASNGYEIESQLNYGEATAYKITNYAVFTLLLATYIRLIRSALYIYIYVCVCVCVCFKLLLGN